MQQRRKRRGAIPRSVITISKGMKGPIRFGGIIVNRAGSPVNAEEFPEGSTIAYDIRTGTIVEPQLLATEPTQGEVK